MTKASTKPTRPQTREDLIPLWSHYLELQAEASECEKKVEAAASAQTAFAVRIKNAPENADMTAVPSSVLREFIDHDVALAGAKLEARAATLRSRDALEAYERAVQMIAYRETGVDPTEIKPERGVFGEGYDEVDPAYTGSPGYAGLSSLAIEAPIGDPTPSAEPEAE